MKVTDPDLVDIIFLDQHPAWTYQDLVETPDIIVAGLKLLAQKRA